MKENRKGIGTVATIVVVIVIIAIVAGVGAWYFMGDDGTTNGGPTNGDGNGNGNGGEAPSEIKIGAPIPVTGGHATFSGPEVDWVIPAIEEAVNADGGIYMSEYDKKIPINIIVRDTETSSVNVSEITETLATRDKVHILRLGYTTSQTAPGTIMAEKYGIPAVVGMDGQPETLYEGAPYEWTFFHFWSSSGQARAAASAFDLHKEETTGIVGLFFPEDMGGRMWNSVYEALLPELGYEEVIVPDLFPMETEDFSSIINFYKQNDVDYLVTGPAPAAYVRLMEQCNQMNFHPKLIWVGMTGDSPSAMEAAGRLSIGALANADVHPSLDTKCSITGMTSQEWADEHYEQTGRRWMLSTWNFWTSYEIIVDALERAGTVEPEALRDAIANTNLETLTGTVNYKSEEFDPIPVPGAAVDLNYTEDYKKHWSVMPLGAIQYVEDPNPLQKDHFLKRIVVANEYVPWMPKEDILFPMPWEE